jgi:nucleotide-binding universal stress UspA family protein
MRAAVEQHFPEEEGSPKLVFDVMRGPVVDCLLTQAAEHHVDLILVGHQRAHSQHRSLARRLAMKAPCSVWKVPEGTPAVIGRILVPIDFSEHSADAMRVATSLARLAGGAGCLALHVYFNEAVVTYEEYDQVLRGEEAKAYQDFMAGINTQGIQVKPLFVESAHIPHAILRAAEQQQVDLIVMPTRGRSRAAAVLLGSVTEGTILETSVPLLVVKHFGAQIGLLQALFNRLFWSRSDTHFL